MFELKTIKNAVDAIYDAAGKAKEITDGDIKLTVADDDAELLFEDGELDDYAFTSEGREEFISAGWELVADHNGVAELRRFRENKVWKNGEKTPRYHTVFIASLDETHNLTWVK